MGIYISKHAKDRAAERGLPPYKLYKEVRRVRIPGTYKTTTGHTLVVEDARDRLVLKTVLAPGMSGQV